MRPRTGPWNLSYVQGMGVNWLWLQPIHPIGVQGRQTDRIRSQAFSGGQPLLGEELLRGESALFQDLTCPAPRREATGRANALVEFQGFVKAADAAGINVMLDVPFNHTSFDCELGAYGQTLWGNASTTGTSLMENTEARIYSRWTGGSAAQTDTQ